MENLLSYLAQSLARRTAGSKFGRYLIGRTGCSSLLFTHETTVHYTRTEEGERVYFYEYNAKGVTYGLIAVGMNRHHGLPQAHTILLQYLNRIRKPFGIAHSLGMQIEQTAHTVELTDYWQGHSGKDWKIKGLCNGKVLAVLYVKNIGHSRVNDHDTYLNGFRFSSPS